MILSKYLSHYACRETGVQIKENLETLTPSIYMHRNQKVKRVIHHTGLDVNVQVTNKPLKLRRAHLTVLYAKNTLVQFRCLSMQCCTVSNFSLTKLRQTAFIHIHRSYSDIPKRIPKVIVDYRSM